MEQYIVTHPDVNNFENARGTSPMFLCGSQTTHSSRYDEENNEYCVLGRSRTRNEHFHPQKHALRTQWASSIEIDREKNGRKPTIC